MDEFKSEMVRRGASLLTGVVAGLLTEYALKRMGVESTLYRSLISGSVAGFGCLSAQTFFERYV